MVNPRDRFIANSTIDNIQFKIALYVDKNKVSHIDEHVNTRIIEAKEEHFGELTVSRGKSTSFWE